MIRVAENPSHVVSGGLVGRHRRRALKELIARRPRGAFRTCSPHSASHAIDKYTGICHFTFACIFQGASCNDKIWAHALNPATWSLRLLQLSHRLCMVDTARQQTVALEHERT